MFSPPVEFKTGAITVTIAAQTPYAVLDHYNLAVAEEGQHDASALVNARRDSAANLSVTSTGILSIPSHPNVEWPALDLARPIADQVDVITQRIGVLRMMPLGVVQNIGVEIIRRAELDSTEEGKSAARSETSTAPATSPAR